MADLIPTSTQIVPTIKKHILTQDQYNQLVTQGYVSQHPYEEYYITDVNDTLNDLGDVQISAPANGQALMYNSSIQRWENHNINNATLTIQKNGVDIGTFTANASQNKTIDIPIPSASIPLVAGNNIEITSSSDGSSTVIVTSSAGSNASISITYDGTTVTRVWNTLNDGGTGNNHYEDDNVKIYMDNGGYNYFVVALRTVIYNDFTYSSGELIRTWSYSTTVNITINQQPYNTISAIVPSVPVTDVTVGGTSVVSSGTAVIPAIPAAVSGTNDGTNWTTITIGDTTKSIPSGGGSSTLSGLTDTDILSPSNGQTLKYNYSSLKWENSDFPTEIPTQTGQSGKFLTTNGTAVSWADAPTELPSIAGNADKILAVNSGATGVEWITNSGGGGDTVTGKTVTLGTTGAAVIQVNGVDSGSVSIPSGSTSAAGIVQLTDSTSSTSTTTAATPNSVKSAYDLASGAIPKSTGTTAGDIIYFTGASTPTRLAKGTAGQVLTMNSGATAPEWQTPSGGGGLTNYNFTHVANTTISSPFTFTCTANQRNTQMITTGANLTLNITCNNGSDNYLWIKNSSSSADIDVAIGTVTYNGNAVSASSIYLPSDGITVPKSGLCEIGIIMNTNGAFITVRNDLAPSA